VLFIPILFSVQLRAKLHAVRFSQAICGCLRVLDRSQGKVGAVGFGFANQEPEFLDGRLQSTILIAEYLSSPESAIQPQTEVVMRAPSPANDGMGSLLSNGTCRFRVWAPNAKLVQVFGDFSNGQPIDLALEPGTRNWSADQIPAKAGDKYQYIITNIGGPDNNNSQPWTRTDARAYQVESSDPASKGYIVGPFPANRPAFNTPAFDEFLIYQLHIGSYAGRNDGIAVTNDTATFVDLIAKLDYIHGLGFNAIEPLPITDCNCDLNGAGMGYGPSDLFASEEAYATSPDKAVAELIQFIDEAHKRGIAVILDVVYNHAAIQNNRYWQYDGNYAGDNGAPGGIYHVHGHPTPWGVGFALWQQEVKDLLLDNARMLLGQYQVDGLRFDAVQAIQADAVEYVVQALRQEFPSKYLIAEYNPNDSGTSAGPGVDPYSALGFCATWDMSSPWDTFKLLNGENTVSLLLARIGGFGDPNPWHLITYLTGSHDQIYGGQGNTGIYLTQRFGGRSNGWARAKARLAWALNATLPGTPMLFMGTEGHIDGTWDPVVMSNAAGTVSSDFRIDWSKIGDGFGAPMQQMVRDVNNLRWAHPGLRSAAGSVVHVDNQNQVVAFTRYNMEGDVLLVVVNAGDGQWGSGNYGVNMGGEGGSWTEIFNSQAPVYGGVGTVGNYGYSIPVVNGQMSVNLSSWSVVVFLAG
jgi:1,4-alpha-glucan branching enzyme